jgi:hypothetical protein
MKIPPLPYVDNDLSSTDSNSAKLRNYRLNIRRYSVNTATELKEADSVPLSEPISHRDSVSDMSEISLGLSEQSDLVLSKSCRLNESANLEKNEPPTNDLVQKDSEKMYSSLPFLKFNLKFFTLEICRNIM